ncbi:YqzK family protein [Bacillus sp. PS06]|uniref:YqzK family protein n=1 Tax=Bacillus sp. PS06 TaxID=2764176 RepID=UPI001785F0A4|nr:YqzK family protein [Bacillus sp. PS06]MBD8070337.1 YqzK family protein [Bacillus sp. PS06]
MRQMLHMMFGTIKIFILFTGCTILFYYGIMWVNQEYENYHRYDEPQGTAVKVSTVGETEYKWFDRLKFFYHYGE